MSFLVRCCIRIVWIIGSGEVIHGRMGHGNNCQETSLSNLSQACYSNDTDTGTGTYADEGISALTGDLALAVFKRKMLSRAVIVTCHGHDTGTNWRVFRKLSAEISASIITPITLWKLENTSSRLGVLFEMDQCPLARAMLSQIQPYVNSSYNWLLVSNDPKIALNSLPNLRFDSSVIVAVPIDVDGFFSLLDVYNDVSEGRKKLYSIGRFLTTSQPTLADWVDAENAPHRSLINRTVNTGFLVAKRYKWTYPLDMERFDLPRGHPRVGTVYFAMKDINVHIAIAQLYNMSSNYLVYEQGGFLKRDGLFTDLREAMHTQKIELAATKLLLSSDPIGAFDFLNMCDSFSLGVIYYISRSVDAPTALLEPFSSGLWFSTLAAISLGVISLLYVGHFEIANRKKSETESDLSVGSAFLTLLGSFTGGQGHPADVRWHSSRIILGVFLLTGFVVASAYSAMITRALLSEPLPNFRSRAEYMRSSLRMVTEDFFPLTLFFPHDTMDNSRRELYEKKVKPPAGGGFRQVTDSFQGMLEKRWAMFGLVSDIKLEMAKASPTQICHLAWIHELESNDKLCPLLKKKSELKNLLSRGYPLMHERGVYDRERRKHHAGDVICLPEYKRQWVPVKIEIVISAVVLVYAGVVAGILVFMLERLSITVQYQCILRLNSSNSHASSHVLLPGRK